MDSKGNDIRQDYALGEQEKEDLATKEWCKLIDLDTVIESNLDWHSTRTFELFLDALDVDQFVIKDDKKSNPKTDTRPKTSNSNHEAKDKMINNNVPRQNGSGEQQQERIPISAPPIKNVDTYQGVETILSAEALKILSELPDLAHMSTTRSFIFPTQKATVRK